eukprot:CAMPEP_0203816706 /NCGR_PEP_ID=MMETSP0115-20131106/17799_1 /ASSEMBLY_ACC=CAM_ASM_000227 /TAXON_ID=33651 /ORGANISM="Bicosoecid sp, Strain ms1" /LENGTH=581 /DNA_ID=CAMNT_0050725615 /DNA_START=10 /DNA_END=1755 /DNA_ORIENTATION=+
MAAVATKVRRGSSLDTVKYPPVEAEGHEHLIGPFITTRTTQVTVAEEAVTLVKTSPLPFTEVTATSVPVERLEAVRSMLGSRSLARLFRFVVYSAVFSFILNFLKDQNKMTLADIIQFWFIFAAIGFILWYLDRKAFLLYRVDRVPDEQVFADIDTSDIEKVVAASIRDMARVHGVPIDPALNKIATGNAGAPGSVGIPESPGEGHNYLVSAKANVFCCGCVPNGSNSINVASGYLAFEWREGPCNLDMLIDHQRLHALVKRVKWTQEAQAPKFTFKEILLRYFVTAAIIYILCDFVLKVKIESDVYGIIMGAVLVIWIVIYFISVETFVKVALASNDKNHVKCPNKGEAQAVVRTIFAQKQGYDVVPTLCKAWIMNKRSCGRVVYKEMLSLFTDRIEHYSCDSAGCCACLCKNRQTTIKHTMALSDVDYVYTQMEGILGRLVTATLAAWIVVGLYNYIRGPGGDDFDTPTLIILGLWIIKLILICLSREHFIYVGNKISGDGIGGGSAFSLRFKAPTGDPKGVCLLIAQQAKAAKLNAGVPVAPVAPVDPESAVALQLAMSDDYTMSVTNPVASGGAGGM